MNLKMGLFCFLIFILHECLVIKMTNVNSVIHFYETIDTTGKMEPKPLLQLIRTHFQQTSVCFQNMCPVLEQRSSYVFLDQGYYKTVYDKERKIPLYSVYVLPFGELNNPRQNVWMPHPDISDSDQPQPQDYNGLQDAKLDKGHLYPQSYIDNIELKRFTNLLSNSAIQNSNLNRGAWRKLETTLKTVSKEHCSIQEAVRYFVTGVIPSKDNYFKKK